MKNPCERALLTDLYELTMLQAYFLQRMNQTAVFELYVRHLPPERNFLIAAGLAQVVDYLATLRFEEDDLTWLRQCGRFDAGFVDSLAAFRFTGDVDAVPEGTIVFADEPLLRIRAPLREAQFIESRLINLMHYQTLVASKAARCVIAAQGRTLIDFGLRRAHGAEAALLSARASYIAGFDSTATVLAAPLFGIPVAGTMAHSFIQVHDFETDAFAAFAHAFPDNATLLIDTYDTQAAARMVVPLARWLREEEQISIRAVRIDSGDLVALARSVRCILDAGDCHDIRIVASGNLDEYALQSLLEQGAPIDAFGVGTRMNTSSDAPYLDCAYKLVEYDGRPLRKRSPGKAPWPGAKQFIRHVGADGLMREDTLALLDEHRAGHGLLQPAMRAGQPLAAAPPLPEIRARVQSQLAMLPHALRTLQPATPYPVRISAKLQHLASEVDGRQDAHAMSDRARWEQDAE